MSVWMMLPYYNRQVELGNMTREEADKIINHMIEIDNMPEFIISEDKLKELMLKENLLNEGLREKSMEIKEAIKRIEKHNRIHSAKEYPLAIRITEALDMAVEALNKQVPMEHHHTIVGECSGGERVRTSICPNCLGCIMTVEEEFPRFCAWCGQAIKWE